MTRVPLVERLRIAKEAHAKGEARAAAPRPADTPEILRAPFCPCGIRKVLCADCREHHCRAPGHARQ